MRSRPTLPVPVVTISSTLLLAFSVFTEPDVEAGEDRARYRPVEEWRETTGKRQLSMDGLATILPTGRFIMEDLDTRVVQLLVYTKGYWIDRARGMITAPSRSTCSHLKRGSKI